MHIYTKIFIDITSVLKENICIFRESRQQFINLTHPLFQNILFQHFTETGYQHNFRLCDHRCKAL